MRLLDIRTQTRMKDFHHSKLLLLIEEYNENPTEDTYAETNVFFENVSSILVRIIISQSSN